MLSEQVTLEELWDTLGECLSELGRTSDSHAVLVLQPAVEAFFLVHGTEKQVIVLFVTRRQHLVGRRRWEKEGVRRIVPHYCDSTVLWSG